jgi:hypothetical protein
MTKKKFDKILIDEGLTNEYLRELLWLSRPTNDLDETKLRKTAKQFMQLPEVKNEN